MKKAAKTMIEVNHITSILSVYQVYQQPTDRGYTSPVKTFTLTGNSQHVQKLIDDLISIYNEEK